MSGRRITNPMVSLETWGITSNGELAHKANTKSKRLKTEKSLITSWFIDSA